MIKHSPEDFKVEELLDPALLETAKSTASGPFALFHLSKESLATPEAVARAARALQLSPRLRLETFAVGKSNRIPHAAAQSVSESPGAVVLPVHDGSIDAIEARRDDLERSLRLALPSSEALTRSSSRSTDTRTSLPFTGMTISAKAAGSSARRSGWFRAGRAPMRGERSRTRTRWWRARCEYRCSSFPDGPPRQV